MSSDERLARRAAKGDQRAFEEIYGHYGQDLYRFCLAMVGNPQDAQDTLQNTMVKVLRALPGEEREIRLKPWLYRIAHNESVETLRRRRDEVELDPEHAAIAGVAEISKLAETRDRLRTLLTDLEQLPKRQRAVLVMRELSGLDFEQIGVSLGTSAAVARQTLYEARLGLRQMEAGREMHCADAMRELSDADGRVMRRRDIRAHLHSCADCRGFREGIERRQRDLAALAPLPLAASASLLQSALGNVSGSVAGAVGAGAGKVVATSAIVKSAATVAVVAAIGVSADRGGLTDLPFQKDGDVPSQSAGESPRSSTISKVSPRAAAVSVRGSAIRTNSPGGESGSSEPVSRKGHQEGDEGKGSHAKGDVPPSEHPSNAHAGLSPPGGGYGRSASDRHGRPEQMPEAADHGQQAAAAHKPPQAASPSNGGGPKGGGHEKPSGTEVPPEASAPKANGKTAKPTAPPPSAEAHAQDDGLAEPASGSTARGHER